MSNEKLTKDERVLKSRTFQEIYKQGSWTANREVSANFQYLKNQTSCLGITVSKKVSKRAVDRNRIKRIFREWFRHRKDEFIGMKLVLTAKPVLNQKTNQEIITSLDDLAKKVLNKNQPKKHR
jgi:ribonuclease P protein component